MIPSHRTLLVSFPLKSAVVSDPLVVSPETTVLEAITKMSGVHSCCRTSEASEDQLDNDLFLGARSSCIIVVEDEQVVGILTQRDVVRLSAQRQPLERLSMREVMVCPVISLRESALTDLFSTVNLLQQHRIRHLPILDAQDRLVGLATHEGLLQALNPLERFKLAEAPEAVERLQASSVELTLALQQATVHQRLEEELSERKQTEALLRESEQRSVKAWRQLQNLIEGTAATTGQNFFPALVKYMSEAFDVTYAIVAEKVDDQLQSLGYWAHGSLQTNFAFNVRNTPCEQALQQGEFYCESGVQQQFPENSYLVDMKAESYLGFALRDSQGEAIGILCLLDQRPFQDLEQAKNLLRVFAARASAELERETAIKSLEQLNRQLENKVEERTAALQASEERWQLALKGTNDGIWDWDLRSNKIYFSSRWKALRGCSANEIGDSWEAWLQCVHPDDKDRLISVMEEHLAGKTEFFEIEYRLRRKDDSYLWVLDRGQALKNTLNQVIRISGSETDITQRKLAAEVLRESEQRYSSLASAAPVAIFRFDTPLNCVYVNDRWSEMTGRPKESALGKGWIEALHPDDRERLLARWQEGYAQSNPTIGCEHAEGRHLLPDGSIHWFEVHVVEETDVTGKIISYIGTLMDITHRKLAEQTIQQQASREALLREITQRIRKSLDLQTIFDTACEEIRHVVDSDRVGIFKFQPGTNYNNGEFVAESVIEEFSSVLKINVHDHCLGDNYSSLYAKGRFFVVADVYNSNLSDCHVAILAQFEVRANLVMPLLCGEQLWGLLCIHQCTKPREWKHYEIELTQQIANQLAIALQQANLVEQLQQELSERQQAQQQLTERHQQLALSNKELARATRLKDEFLANMSHELRTPLNAILGVTEGLQEQVFGKISNEQIKVLQTIEHSSTHLLELINDILDVAKIEAGQINLDCAPTAVAPLCQSSLAFIKQQALKKHIQIETQLPSSLPDLIVDERRVRQVLINLLNNAVKFTPEGGKLTLEVTQLYPELDMLDPQYFLQFAVKDTGIGIAKEHIKQLFQPFVQIDSALNRQYMGTGLGLALVKRIVELHGGKVGLMSELGVGSCFTVELPCDDPAHTYLRSHQHLTSTHHSVPPEHTTSPVILLAEDNEANIITISSYLVVKGYQILSAKNGQEAVKLAQTHHPDVILMDIQMPIMDGFQAMREIRLDPNLAEIVIIALTALAMPGDRERCLEAGANAYICKPVKLKQLTTTIQQFLTSQRK